MKVAVTGSNGLLGQHLVNQLLEDNYVVVAISKGTDRTFFSSHASYKYYESDIADQNALQNIFQSEKPSLVVHAAAVTQVDDCETNPEYCERVNVRGTINALMAAEKFCLHFIYVSTDFVFDGLTGNYSEEEETIPISFYGITKLAGEKLVKNCPMPWAIVRTCLVYGNTLSGTRSNIITWVKQNLEQGKKIKVVSDQVRTPTYVEDLAKGILLIIKQKATGVFHISGKDILTPFAMAIQTADYFGLNKELIEEVTASSFTQPAKRPPKTGFSIAKASKELGYNPLSFTEGLQKMFNR